MNVNEAIAAVKANPPLFKLPLIAYGWSSVMAADHTACCSFSDVDVRDCVLAHVNAAPVLIAEVERLQAVVEAARVAVEALPQNAVLCACAEFWPGQGHPDDCPTTQLTNAIDKARRALGLEVKNGL